MATIEQLKEQAEGLGIDISKIDGTGADGSVVKADLEKAVKAEKAESSDSDNADNAGNTPASPWAPSDSEADAGDDEDPDAGDDEERDAAAAETIVTLSDEERAELEAHVRAAGEDKLDQIVKRRKANEMASRMIDGNKHFGKLAERRPPKEDDSAE